MDTMQRDPVADAAALGFAILVSLSFGAGVILLASGTMGWAEVLVLIAGVAFGKMAPGRWLAALGGVAAAGAVALLLPGAVSPWAGALMLPGVAVGSWIGHRPAPGETVSWPDAVLSGLSVEVTVLFTLGFALPFAVVMAAAMGLGLADGGAQVLGAVLGVGVMLGYAVFAGWMHVRAGWWAHDRADGRFAGFAVGQMIPAAALALAIGEPEGIGILAVLVALRLALVRTGYARAHAAADAARLRSITPPSPVAGVPLESASSPSTLHAGPGRRAMPLGS